VRSSHNCPRMNDNIYHIDVTMVDIASHVPYNGWFAIMVVDMVYIHDGSDIHGHAHHAVLPLMHMIHSTDI
jgi:hypothetical protein